MWSKLDDGLIDHTKVESAVDILGGNAGEAYVRVLGAVAWGIVYSNRRLTDGFLPLKAVQQRGIPVKVTAALLEVNLWEEVPHGYRVHDFHDYNPTAAEVKERRRKDAERQRSRRGYSRTDARSHAGRPTSVTKDVQPDVQADSRGTSAVCHGRAVPVPSRPVPEERSSPADRPGALRGKESEETQSPAGAQSTGAAAPGFTRPLSVRRPPPERPAFAQVVELVRAERDRLLRNEIPFERPDLVEQCKVVAAQAGLVYDSTTLGRALDALEHTERSKP